MRVSTIISLVLALVAVAVAFGMALAARPAARRVRARSVPWWAAELRRRVPAGVFVLVAGAAVAAALAFVFVEILDGVVENDDLTVIDRPVVDWVAERRTGWVSALVVSLTDIGGKVMLTVLLAGVAVAVAYRLRSWRPIVLAAVTGFGVSVLVAGSKVVIARERPDPLQRVAFEPGFSFPSGHAASTLVVLGTVAWLISIVAASRTVRATAWLSAGLLTVGVGLSRVYLGVHYPSDVLGGWVLGATWLLAVALAARLPDSPMVPLMNKWPTAGERWRGAMRRSIVVISIAALAGFAAITGIVGILAVTDPLAPFAAERQAPADTDGPADGTRSAAAVEPKITAAEARAIALREAGEGRTTEVELEWEEGVLVWSVDVMKEEVEYDVDVDALTGFVLWYGPDN